MSKYLALDSGLPGFPQDSVSHGTWEFRSQGISDFAYPAITVSGLSFQTVWLSSIHPSTFPQPSDVTSEFRLLRFRSPLTYAISIDFFSSCYLDVSVHSVPPPM